MRFHSLDGLRGVAIIMVLLLHHKLFNNGWMGVDLFFVLSGFLITGILRKDRNKAFFWKRFYIKRSTRILPPMVLTCLLAYIFTPGASLLVILGYLFTLGGFIDLDKKIFIEPVGPTWSLAIEEHFYLAWPFVIRFMTRKRALVLLLSLLVMVPLLRLAYSHPMPTADLSVTYFLTPFRVDEMAFGCLLALLTEDPLASDLLKHWSKWGFWAIISIYLGTWIQLNHIQFYPGGHTKLFDSMGYWLVALASFFLIAHLYLNHSGVAARLFSFGPLAWLGRISYGVYLYHILLRALVMKSLHIDSQRMALVYDFPVTICASWLSFRYFEQPIIAWGRRRAGRLGSTGPDIVVEVRGTESPEAA